jgi:hypothetical protein
MSVSSAATSARTRLRRLFSAIIPGSSSRTRSGMAGHSPTMFCSSSDVQSSSSARDPITPKAGSNSAASTSPLWSSWHLGERS